MYEDESLTPCPECGKLSTLAPNLHGKLTRFHKVPSKREGYFTFTDKHSTKKDSK